MPTRLVRALKTRAFRALAPTPLGRRGIALPVALLALVALTLMVTTVMITSGSEGAASRAHMDAAQSLYDAEAGVMQYASGKASAQAALTTGTDTVTLTGSARKVAVTRELLADSGTTGTGRLRTWAITGEAVRSGVTNGSGRVVVAMVRQYTQGNQIGLNIQSAITLGGDLHLNGNAFTVNGRNTCGTGNGFQAVQSSDSSQIDTKFNNNFTGYSNGQQTSGRSAIDSTNLTRTQLMNQVLGNKTLAQIVSLVPTTKKWCSTKATCLYTTNDTTNRVWTGSMPTGDSLAVIDANGGQVEVQSGQGLIIVMNGSLLMKGNDTFNGIIITEGNFTLEGTPTVTGALISLAMNGTNEITQDQSAIAQGHVTVQFNQCMVTNAINAFSSQASPPTTSSTTFGWSEIVR